MKRLAALGALVVVALVGCTTETPRNSAGQVTAEATTDVFSIKVGDCVDKVGTGTVGELKLVPCSEPHYWEAYASSQVTGDTYPGTSTVQEQADADCGDAFAEFIGIELDKSDYTYTYLHHTSESWAQNDREILCLAGAEDGGIKGTLKGAKK